MPVITDGGAMGLANGAPQGLVRFSSSFGASCPAVAGNSLQGHPVPNTGVVWAERARTWGPPLAGPLLVGLLVWRRGRRRQWERTLEPLPFIYRVGGR